jgi:type IV pilus assembly protein PilC
MATAVAARRDVKVRELTFLWEGVDRNNKPMRGELRAVSETVASTNLRRQGIRVLKI